MIQIPAEWDVIEPLIIEQYKESPQYLGILKLIADEADRTETARWELSNLLDIDAMVGAQLDLLGKIAHAPRLQDGVLLDDVAYRIVLKAAFRARTSGTPEEIIAAARSATNSSQVIYLPEYPAAYWLFTDGPIEPTQAFLESISPAGVLPMIPCLLSDTTDDLFLTTDGDTILVVGPCSAAVPFPADNVWDGGMGAVDPDSMVIAVPWPFRDGTGVGEYPSGGMGSIDPNAYTFLDGTYAEDTGG